MPERLILWGPPAVNSTPDSPDYAEHLPDWVKKCADVGISKIIGGDRTLALTEAAHEVGIKVDPYINYNSFPRYGSARVTYGWSVDFIRVPVDDPQANAILKDHIPIYDAPKVTTTVADFASKHPEYRSLTRSCAYTLNPGEDVYLSPAFPEVRENQSQIFLDTLTATKGDGIQVEFVLGNEDENGVVPYGYEDRVVAEFREKTGKDAFALPNDDPEWMQFRADYVTLFLSELRTKVKRLSPNAVFSTTMITGEPDDYLKLLHDWPAWIEQGILDEFYIWFRTDSDLTKLEQQIRHAVGVANGRVPVIAELSAYHPGSFQDPELMLAAGKIVMNNGADGLGIYRSHAVEQLDLWPVLEKLGEL
ncbi:family 10 glycosylhydrolase [Chloroflexi bacterium TSY]|nr:family 10 glycosylhydrolase [Chloroflexi bacterium TSY]